MYVQLADELTGYLANCTNWLCSKLSDTGVVVAGKLRLTKDKSKYVNVDLQMLSKCKCKCQSEFHELHGKFAPESSLESSDAVACTRKYSTIFPNFSVVLFWGMSFQWFGNYSQNSKGGNIITVTT